MNIFRLFPILLVALVLAACSTTVTMRQPADMSNVGAMRFDNITVDMTTVDATDQVAARLKADIAARLAKIRQGDKPVTVAVTITSIDIVNPGARALAGAFAGANRMDVSVKVTDQSGAVLMNFDVKRSSNPGGYGLFYNQRTATVDAVADGIADALAGKT